MAMLTFLCQDYITYIYNSLTFEIDYLSYIHLKSAFLRLYYGFLHLPLRHSNRMDHLLP